MITGWEVLVGIVLPVAIGLVAMFALKRWKGLGASLGIGAGFVVGYFLLIGREVVSPSDRFHWLWWAGVVALAWAVIDSAVRLPALVRYFVIVAGAFGLSAALLWPLTRSVWEGSEGYAWVGGVGLAVGAAWLLLDLAARRVPGTWMGLVYVGAATVTAIVVGASGSMLFAKLAGALAAATGGAWLGGLITNAREGTWMARGATAVLVVGTLGMTINGKFWVDPGIYWPVVPLLVVGPLGIWTAVIAPARWPEWKQNALGVAVAAALLASAAAVAGWHAYQVSQEQANDPASMYGA